MAGTPHTHGNAPPHEHADAAPGHAHDAQGNVTGAGPTTAAGTGAAAGTAAGGAGAAEHRHSGIGSHSHADARPGHEHDERVTRERAGGWGPRLILGVVGAAGMIVGPFFPWTNGERGTAVEFRAFFSAEAGSDAGFVASAGFVLLVLGVIALVGLLFRSGWLTSLAAGLGLAATILIAVSTLRGAEGLGGLGIGWWMAAIGSLLALVASMFATRTREVETRRERVP